MENKAFFVRYLTNQSVKVETHYIGEQDRQRPLTDVADLVAAYKPGSLLADTPTELLTLHYAVDRPAIAGDVLLTSIQEPVGSYNQPLVIKSKNGTGQGISSAVSGAPVGSNTGMVSGTFEETADTETTVSLLKYHHIADSLKDDKCVVQIVDVLLSITAGEFSESSFKNLPFVFLKGSSGSGKSQMGFNIKANIGDRRRVHYLLFDPPGSTSQRIYRNFENISKLFSKCYVEDEHMYTSETSSPSCGSLFKESLYMYGFIFELLSNKFSHPQPVFILDECIAISDQSLKKVRFVRNCFRSLGLGLVMMGTDSRAAKLQLSIGGSSRSDVPMPWCHVFGEFPAVKLELTGLPQTLPRYLKSIILNSRPLFAQFVAEEIANKVSDFDELMKAAFIKLKSVKKIFGNLYGQLGQVRLFHNAHCQLTDLESQSTNLKNQSTPLIHSHFAQLDGKKNFILMNDGCIQDHSASWEPSSVFPELKNDILLYLLLMGGKGFSACYTGDNKQVPYAYFLMEAKSNPDYRSHILYFSNAVQDSNDGMFLKSLLCSTVCLASHSNGVKGIGLKPFLLNLVYQLQIDKPDSEDVSILDLNRLDGITFTVPFLSPPNQKWPDFVQIPGLNFNWLSRARNSEGIDLKTSCGLFGESKDHKGVISLETMVNIIGRIPQAAEVELVFTRKLQDSYFNPPAPSFEVQFQRSHVLKKAYYKIDASKPNTLLEPIKGLPCDQPDMDGVVIFFEINDRVII
ncbi:hypothetical protein BATDEDRAFT_91239 [Batrachochytrium dendrobatidis JAM81]|uniref:Uncharacterized protein n=1 Tax=Batrachochytrium dendrobatidis (strain JAM81 / FGSC 10211) TaxID=684364 RepID=F4P9M7_BATDJ|nr:uncharacterized protein BATDEDRAFT_91239 [Batrachochytrium dendrobatidis JAM81]EGF77945.1 hypothetical protein BATDEDRAFT_91239 [Batrachochytrium dendrobatidis JAM81]|eukprot:XP_006681521.1 hypothetical protein BATDEDRAFT_91239 [Batrachochytrium dendrobatidis JAM81]